MSESENNSRRCTQEQCEFYLRGGCKACKDCKSESLIINTHCAKCLACENVPGALRWDDPKTNKVLQVVSISDMIKLNEISKNNPPEKQQEKMIITENGQRN